LLHASPESHSDGCAATGDIPVVSKAHDPYPADVDENQNRKWQENDAYSDAVSGSTPAQPFPSGTVAPKGARSTNPEIFRRGWKSAGPPHPELLPDMDDSDGANATIGARVSGALDGSVPASQTADYGYAHEKATFETPICGQRTEMSDGYAPGPMHGVAYGAPPRRRMNDMTTDYDYDAHAASYDAPPCAADDVESGYAPDVSAMGTRAHRTQPRAELCHVEPATAPSPRYCKLDGRVIPDLTKVMPPDV